MPTVTVDKKEFLESLNRVYPTKATSRLNDQLKCFCFQEDRVCTYNGQAGTVTACDLGGAEFCIQADRLWNVVNAMPGEMKLNFEDEQLIVSSGRNRTTLCTEANTGFPDIIPENSELFYDEHDLLEALLRVSFSIGYDPTKPELLGAAVIGNHIYASDGNRITRVDIKGNVAEALNIPASTIEHISKLGEPDYFFCANKSQIGCIYKDTQTVYVSSTLEGNFPVTMCEEVLKYSGDDYYIEFPEELEAAISRVSILVPADDPDIIIENTEDGLNIRTASELGDSNDWLDWNFTEKFMFAVHPAYMLATLKKCRNVDLTEVISGQGRFLQFFSEGFSHILGLKAIR